MDTKGCCDVWWERLTNRQKEWVHYYFFDIERKDITEILGCAGVHNMHEFKFATEGHPR